LPPSSSGLLPESLAKKMNTDDKDIGEWMNMDLELDSDFKHQEWEYVLLIPGIDQSKFMEVFSNCASSFNQTENKRNVRGVIYVYYTDGEDCYIKEVSPSY
jgi:5'-3' exonuclease